MCKPETRFAREEYSYDDRIADTHIGTDFDYSSMGAIAGIVSYQILLIVLIFLRPDLDPSWHTISEWAIGRYGWMMSAGFLISAAS